MEGTDRKHWSEEEDIILTELVKEHGSGKWANIARIFKEKYDIPNKTGKQCRERWNNNLNPKVTKETWTPEEEKILFDQHKIVGNKWSVIAGFLKGRTDNSTKNHFYSIARKNLRKYNKTKPEKDKLASENIQELLKDPEISKILLKRPRHYYKKTKKIVKDTKKSPELKIKVEETAGNKEEEKLISENEAICIPTPVSSVCRSTHSSNSFCFQQYPETISNFICDSTRSTETSGISPHDFYFSSPRGYNLNNNQFFMRNPSRESSLNSMCYSDVSRGNSRKSSGKNICDFNERGDSRKSSGKETMDFSYVNFDQQNFIRTTWPQYAVESKLKFSTTPKNKK